MAIEALVWDVNNGFSEAELAQPLVAAVVAVDPDVAIFPRAYSSQAPAEKIDTIRQSFAAVAPGYAWANVEYLADRPTNLLMLTRRTVLRAADSFTIADRPALKQSLVDQDTGLTIDCIGLDLDARREATRQDEVHDLLAHLGGKRTLVAGNFHAMLRLRPTRNMHPTPRHIRFAAHYARLAERFQQRQSSESSRLGALSAKYRQLGETASGKTMSRLIEAGFFDADAHYEPTEPAENPVIQSTHLMLKRGQFIVNQFNTLHDAAAVALAPDNRAITATVSLHEPKQSYRTTFEQSHR